VFHAAQGDVNPPVLVMGEMVLNVVQHVRYTLRMKLTAPPSVGNLYLTNYRLIFSSYIKGGHDSRHTRRETPSAFDELSVPLASILRLESPKTEASSVLIHCKVFVDNDRQ
jgi:hypothetical protein